ncbi:MAG: PA14 domain-containing protein, partial [Planctomycetota bacterium]|nr:PA14 domain-containing protein [Planctomycetota bacterium]
ATYYWRVDEVEADGATIHKGKVWSFFIPPVTAYQEVPGDGSMFVPADATLEWTAGFNAKLHYVYFGDDPDVVANATGGAPLATTTFDPGSLELDKTYYWRVDEFDPPFTHTGDVWAFTTTLSGLGTAIMDRWENMSGVDINTLKDNAKFPNNPDVTETVDEFAWDGADLSDYGARIEAWVYAPATGDYTFWLACDDNGELWVSPDDDSSNAVLVASIPGWTNVDEWTKYPTQKSEPISLVAGEKYYVMAIWKEGGGGDNCQVAWEGPGIEMRTVIPGGNLSPYEPVSAFGAKPANGAVGVTQTPTLRWKAGLQAESHEVYFGTDEAAVANATKTSPEYKGSKSLGDESFSPGKLDWETTYYWRVDEINAGNTDSPWVGSVLSFTTAGFLIVDDFEGYTDNDADNEAIWQIWIDGFGVNTNGSQVGYVMPPYAEQSIIQGGRQSMPLFYNNTAGVTNSEAELTLTIRNWTEGGVAALSLWFQGRPASTGGFTEGPVGTFTVNGSGTDIWNNGTAGDYRDEFHFAYKTLTGTGTIIARVDSVQQTNVWAKAGVMIRETLEPGSKHAFAAVTPASGVASQGRIDTSGVSFNTAEGGITAPHWVKLERDMAGNFTVSHSANGSAWVPVSGAVPENIQMGSTVFVGLAVTSHDVALTCEAVFSN